MNISFTIVDPENSERRAQWPSYPVDAEAWNAAVAEGGEAEFLLAAVSWMWSGPGNVTWQVLG